jgi:hypothetical protein
MNSDFFEDRTNDGSCAVARDLRAKTSARCLLHSDHLLVSLQMGKKRSELRIPSGLTESDAAVVVTEEDVIQACIDRDFVTLRRWGQQDVRVCGLASGIALETAIINNDVDLVRCLVKDLGFDVRSQFLNTLPPAFVAAKEGHSDMLLCLGADIVQESNGYTPFHISSHFGHLDLLRCLVNDLGAISNSAARFFRKPLRPKWGICMLSGILYRSSAPTRTTSHHRPKTRC